MKRALVVIDVQNEYFTGALPIAFPPRQESLANIVAAAEAARAHGVPVVVVRHTAPAESPMFAGGSPSWELREEIGREPYDHLVDKTLASAFAGTDLAEWLAAEGVDTLAIAGYMTQNCDESTARDAAHLGLSVEFLSDATGTVPLSNSAGT
ncbi:cysteine hydrolase family protein, partial [Streptosporangium saharense]|uniref:cysteine hydrolase family protein n=1 Tax=Streptosporangium saharense TaxID=1706840 RepID=UPI0033203655